MLVARCRNYQIEDPNCPSLARRFIQLLDFTIIETDRISTPVSFPEVTCNHFMATDIFQVLEQQLVTGFQGSASRGAIFNVLKAKLGFQRALEVMGTLLQDHGAQSQLNYLKSYVYKLEETDLVSRHLQILSTLIKAVTLEQDLGGLSEASNPETTTDRAYHIFVPALVASKLVDEGADPKLAAQIAFMFNTFYEYIGIGMSRIFKDPSQSNSVEGALETYNGVVQIRSPLLRSIPVQKKIYITATSPACSEAANLRPVS